MKNRFKSLLNNKRAIFIVSAAAFIVFAVCFTMVITGRVILDCHGVGVDSNGNFYYGADKRILKIVDNEIVNYISAPYRSYAFVIRQNDEIVCANGTNTDVYDLNGSLLRTQKNTGALEYNRFIRERWAFEGANGEKYKMTMPLGRRMVVSENGEVIWRMPISDYVTGILCLVSFIVISCCLLVILYHYSLVKDWVI